MKEAWKYLHQAGSSGRLTKTVQSIHCDAPIHMPEVAEIPPKRHVHKLRRARKTAHQAGAGALA